MKLRDAFLSSLGRALAAPAPEAEAALRPPPADASSLVSRLWQIYLDMKLPHFDEDEVRQLAVYLDPELRGIVNDCIAVLARRPALGARLELTAEGLQDLVRLGLELDRLAPIAEDLCDAAEGAIAATLATLGAFCARVLLWVNERVEDTGRPAAERQGVLDLFRGALAEEERQQAERPGRREGRPVEALRTRISAARDSRAVNDAMARLRAVAGLAGSGGTP